MRENMRDNLKTVNRRIAIGQISAIRYLYILHEYLYKYRCSMLDASSFVASTPVNEFAKLTINLRTRQTGQTGVRRYINGTCIEWHAERKVSPINSLERDLTKIRIYVYNLIAVIYRIRMLRISICVFNGSRKIEKNSMKGNTSLTRMMPLGDPLLRPRCDPVFRIGGGFSAQPIVVAGSV
jgi:hypothetical protein